MENKGFNIDDVNEWLKDQYGMSYDELSKEFNKAVNLLSESLKQRKEMREKRDEAIKYIDRTQMGQGYKNVLHDILKEDK